ncbi:radical SAM/SPASM domain-containing protein [uncultured Selenomonas sp.]|uniref:radical SAM/SPASM domain-containing protein n=1 Tax=uncultured Selenomonas sp. TaxID=159275 RepID=UPI0025E7FFDB|nr:radical SAM/SPASM domain-containing protein [uncultured Selenomonas sp.]
MYEDVYELEKRLKKSEFPLNVAIEITNRCNLNCIMCNNDKLTRPRGYMNMELYRKIVDEIAEKSPHARVWLDFYGEPLLAQYKLYFMIDYAKKRGLTNICMNTNATLLNREMADMLLDSGIDFISFDVYGFSKEVLERVSRGADRDKIYENVAYFLERKRRRGLTDMVAEVKVLDLPENHAEVEQILSYWRERGAWTTRRRAITWGGKVEIDALKRQETKRAACGYAVGLCAITWEGNVATCALDADAETTFGNVRDESIADIWARRNRKLVELHLAHRFGELPSVCQRCQDWRIIGEERWDDEGRSLVKSYDPEKKMLAGH